MTIDKRMKYEMQGGTKPARNYLGAQKTVSGIPVKWKSGPDHPETELAYITKAEKDLLLKKDLHGSLKNGPNTGPDGIMSLNDQGDYTADRSPRGRAGRSRQGQAQHEANMKAILTGQKNIGQTTKTGPKTRKYAVPEYVKVKQPGGGYKDKYIGSGYKSYGTPSFWGNLFSRGAPGYRGIKGMPVFGSKPGFEARKGPEGFGYYSDKENFGETRGAMPLGIMGILAKIMESFKKPKDFSSDNRLGLYEDRFKEDFEIDPTVDRRRAPNAWSDGTFTWGGKKPPASKQYYGIGPVPPSDKFANTIAPRPVNVPASNLDQATAGDDYSWYDPTTWDMENNPAFNLGETVFDLTKGENAPPENPDKWQLARDIWPIYKGALEDAGVEQWGENLQEDVSNKGWADTITDRLTNIDTKIPDALRWGSGMTEFIPKGTSIGDAFKGYENLGERAYNEQWLKNNPIHRWGENIGEKGIMESISDLFSGGADDLLSFKSGTKEDALIKHLQANPDENPTRLDRLKRKDVENWDPEKGGDPIDNPLSLPANQYGEILYSADGGRVGYANGGLASLFTRRG